MILATNPDFCNSLDFAGALCQGESPDTTSLGLPPERVFP